MPETRGTRDLERAIFNLDPGETLIGTLEGRDSVILVVQVIEGKLFLYREGTYYPLERFAAIQTGDGIRLAVTRPNPPERG